MFKEKSVGKSGQGVMANVFIGIIVLLVVIVGISAAVDWKGASSITDSVQQVSETIMAIAGPMFRLMLNLDAVSDANVQFLIVLAFVMISVIVIGTLDSINIFGTTKQGYIINFVVGMIVSIIGIRFMPNDIWASLTAPSSAFVATMLVGIPFLAMGFVSMKIKSKLARKMIWLFYIVVMIYLMFYQTADYFIWVYLTFMLLAGIMMYYDAEVIRFFYKEKAEREIERDVIGKMSAIERYEQRAEIKAYQKIIGDSSATPDDVKLAKTEIKRLERLYGDLSDF